MKKRLLSILLTVCMVLTLLPGFTQPAMAAANGTGITGSGTEGSPYIITSADQLAYVAQQVNANGKINSGAVDAAAAYYELGNNIDLATYSNWTPIGWYATFKGKFDGVGHSISNLKINTTSTADNQYYGLFGNNQSGTIINVSLTGINITVTNAAGELCVGGLVGYNDGTVLNCSVTGTLAGAINASRPSSYTNWGGLVGENHQGTLKNCYSAVSVSVTGIANPQAAGNPFMGGVAGRNTANSEGRVLYNYWLFTAQVPTGVDSMGGDQDRATSAGFTGTDTLNGKVTVGGTETLSLREALNAGLGILARTDLYTWISAGNYPVFGSPWTPPTYAATVTVNKDGNTWSGSGKSFALYQSSTKKYDLTLSGSSATVSALAGTYDVYDNTTDTGVDISVSSSGGNAATVNYYTLALSAGTGTASPTGAGAYLPGKSVSIDATVNSGYTWGKWTSSNTGLLSDQSTKSTGIVMPSGAITLTATSTLDTYTITYTLNGGTVSSPNLTSYTIESAAITLNTPTRSGYSFLGWTGSNGATAQTNVNIPTGSTGNKTYTANWKANKPTSAPATSIVTEKTDTSFTITTGVGDEYSVDGTNWHSNTGSYTFTGLSPNTAYNLVCRKAAMSTGDISSASDPSAALPVTTKNAAPTAPTLAFDSITASSVTITAVAGAEYSKDNGATWQSENAFIGLTPATSYSFAIRIKETDDTMPSATASKTQHTPAAKPTAGVGYSINYETEKITVESGYEVNTKEDFTGTAVTNNTTLTPGATYYLRVAANGGVPASEAVSFTIPARPATPTSITADITKNSITITPDIDQQFKIGTGAWQDSGSFTGLNPNTGYTVFTRVKATGTVFASEAYSISVTTKSDGSAGFTLPSFSVSPTYAPGQTLANITLPTGWTWSSPTTVPTVTNSGYTAVYTPTDTATVDYSGVTGYDSATGKITQTITLTVNRATPAAADFTFTAPTALDYDNTTKPATVTAKSGISGMGAVTVKYYQGGTEIASPTNAGTYTVKIDLAQGDNYAAATDVTDSAWTFTIAKVPQASLSITEPLSVIYGDTFTLATTGGSSTGAVTWQVAPGGSATVNENTGEVTITGVGETAITATKAVDGNYTDAAMDTYTFTPAQRLITVGAPSATGGWTKTYDGKTDFDKSIITVGGITNKVGSDAVNVAVQSAAYNTADVGSGNKTLTITYAIDGTNSGNYAVPNNTVISTASIAVATPTITIKSKTAVYTDKKIEIDAATVKGVTGGTTPDGVITYTYYTKDTCTDTDKTTVDKSGAEATGGAPKTAGTYYVKATIAASSNYAEATSTAATLTIYYPSSGEANASTPVIVDGKTVNIGTEKKSGDTTTVTVDQLKLGENINNAASGSSVVVTVSGNGAAKATLVVKNIEDMAAKGMTLTVQSGNVAYNLATSAIDTAALEAAFPGADMSKVPFDVTVTSSSAAVEGETLVLSPVAFTVTATYNGQTVSVDTFSAYIDRVIEVTAEQAAKITTAVVVNADGSTRHVPTSVIEKNGKYYAVINSRTNSTYALIQNEVTFADAAGKWYEAAVNEMGSRKIIAGRGASVFDGGASITRAEFATILVRALGLPADGTSSFLDVPTTAWYTGAVSTAAQYGLVTGKGEKRFEPTAAITRQEAMLMLQRAGRLTEFAGVGGSLSGFRDADTVGAWAEDAAKWSVGSDLIQGADGKLNPTANITRAESATIILRLLQKAELVDVRS